MKYPTTVLSLTASLLFAAALAVSAQPLPWQWAEQHGGSAAGVNASRIAVDGSGNSYVTGAFSGTAEFGSHTLTGSSGSDIYIVKMNPDGDVLWARSAGGAGSHVGRSIAVDAQGNAYVTGSFRGSATFDTLTVTGGSNDNVFLAKYSAAGAIQWVRAGGGSGADISFAVALDGDGNPYITGLFSGTAIFGGLVPLSSAGGTDIFVVAYSASGDEQWAVRAGGSGTGFQADSGRGLAVDPSGDVYVSGHFGGAAQFGSLSVASAGSLDAFVAKYSPAAGAWQWVRRGGGIGDDMATDIKLDSAGNVYVTGTFAQTATFGGTTMTAPPSFSFVDEDYFVAKYDPSGTLLWVRQAGGVGFYAGHGITVDVEDNVYLAATFDFTVEVGATTLTSEGLDNFYVAKFDPAGDVEWVVHGPGDFLGIATGIAADSSGNLYLAGWFVGDIWFDDATLSSGTVDIFVAKMGLEREPTGDIVNVVLDIRPGSCVNPLQVKSNGVLPVAVLGTVDFDVSEIDLSTVGLWRTDGAGGTVTPLESKWAIEDVGTCDVEGDGIDDLTLKFSTSELVQVLELDGLPRGTVVELAISGALNDGTEFAGIDVVLLR